MEKSQLVIEFPNDTEREIFMSWMSNAGEQVFFQDAEEVGLKSEIAVFQYHRDTVPPMIVGLVDALRGERHV